MTDYTHCPHCGTILQDRGWCRHCGDIGELDEYEDDEFAKTRSFPEIISNFTNYLNKLFK